jgi:hypothetical protein
MNYVACETVLEAFVNYFHGVKLLSIFVNCINLRRPRRPRVTNNNASKQCAQVSAIGPFVLPPPELVCVCYSEPRSEVCVLLDPMQKTANQSMHADGS